MKHNRLVLFIALLLLVSTGTAGLAQEAESALTPLSWGAQAAPFSYQDGSLETQVWVAFSEPLAPKAVFVNWQIKGGVPPYQTTFLFDADSDSLQDGEGAEGSASLTLRPGMASPMFFYLWVSDQGGHRIDRVEIPFDLEEGWAQGERAKVTFDKDSIKLGESLVATVEIAYNTGMGVYPAFSLRLVTTDHNGQTQASGLMPAEGFLDNNLPLQSFTLTPRLLGSVVLEVNVELPDGEGGFTTTVSDSIQVTE